jgi:hypothetical protein
MALAAALFIVLLLVGACSGEENDERTDSTERITGLEETTVIEETTGREKTESPSPPEATLGRGPDSPGIVLRLEGDPETTFSGICTVGGKENVLSVSGRVPKRYAFEGQRLSCRIQKQDSGRGSLKVILTANGTTRSVQQANTPGSVIRISYQGG